MAIPYKDASLRPEIQRPRVRIDTSETTASGGFLAATFPWAFGALGAAAQLPLIVDAVHVLGDELHLLHTADPAAVDESP